MEIHLQIWLHKDFIFVELWLQHIAGRYYEFLITWDTRDCLGIVLWCLMIYEPLTRTIALGWVSLYVNIFTTCMKPATPFLSYLNEFIAYISFNSHCTLNASPLSSVYHTKFPMNRLPCWLVFPISIYIYVLVNYNNLTPTSLECWLVRGIIPI